VALTTGSATACQELLTTDVAEQMRLLSGPHKDNPLQAAVRRGDLAMARMLVDAGAAVDMKNVQPKLPS